MTSSKKSKIGNLWASAPLVDHIVPILVVAAWLSLTQAYFPADQTTRNSVFTLIATVSGLAMAATTFACSMTYQSANVLMTRVKDLFAVALRRNWVTIIRSNLMTAFIPILALVLDGRVPMIAAGAVIYAAALLLVRFLRALYWLQYTLFMQQASASVPEKVVVPLREDLR